MTTLPPSSYHSVPFANYSISVDGTVFNISRAILALRSNYLKTLFEGMDTVEHTSEAIQQAWDSARHLSEQPNLEFVALLEALYTGQAGRSIPPMVLDYFLCVGVSTPCMLITTRSPRFNEFHLLPMHGLSDAEVVELTQRPRQWIEDTGDLLVMDVHRRRVKEIVAKCVGSKTIVLKETAEEAQDLSRFFNHSCHIVMETSILYTERSSRLAQSYLGLAYWEDRSL
jgi:hypothetical protein